MTYTADLCCLRGKLSAALSLVDLSVSVSCGPGHDTSGVGLLQETRSWICVSSIPEAGGSQ